MDDNFCPTTLKNKLAIHIPFQQKIIDYEFNNWPAAYNGYLKEGKSSPFFLKHIYEKLGLN